MGLRRFYHNWKLRREDREVGPIISQSGLFDRDYYLDAHPDAARDGTDPFEHYIRHGRRHGYAPSHQFDPRSYIKLNPDVAQCGLDPFVHYIQHGRLEGRLSQSNRQIVVKSGLFDPEYYRTLYLDAALSAQDPLQHYLNFGRRENRRPSLDFDPKVYLANNPDILSAKLDPLLHYIEFGQAEGRFCRKPGMSQADLAEVVTHIRSAGLFDDAFYLHQCPFMRQANVDPLLHYLVSGVAQFVDPSPAFSTVEYKRVNPEVDLAGWNPLLHYLGYGYDENIGDPLSKLPLPDGPVTYERKAGDAYFLRYGFSFASVDSPGPFAVDAVAELALRSPNFTVDRLNPDVSIIIPVYGQLPFVLGCLDSLSRQVSRFSVEILIADDASPEAAETARLKAIPWIRYCRNAANAGFLDNCNEAATTARGRFLVFLNSDTRVAPGWLDELIGSFALFSKAGLVGSSLFHGNGNLQEAGAILWRDGSAWNYGYGDEPNHPKYCFARKVDYASGAAIAIPAEVWRLMGGFDTSYRPAYYEDTDLAMRLRKAGYEVWVQPLARVVHYEGKTHGRDLNKGVKRHQAINMRQFVKRWGDVLSKHRLTGQDPDREASRAVRNRLLVLDSLTPTPDKDSGSFITVRMLKAFQELGYQITFVPQHNYLYAPEYTDALQRIGIECLYSPYFDNVSEVLDFRNDFDVVLAYRCNVLYDVYEEIRQRMPSARIIFHNVDLHFLREEREAALSGDRQKKISAALMKAAELELIAKVDCTIVHTSVETEIIKKHVPVKNIIEFPYVAELHRTKVDFDDRHDVLFLGGMHHPPNVDAVKHFVESLWPVLARDLPANANFLIVGPQDGSDIHFLAGPRVTVTGFVKDLQPYFDLARIFVAPLRYGAGIKGKVVQSLCYGTPSVITPVAAEGIGLVSGRETLIADTDELFIEQLLTLYSDRKQWTALQAAGYRFVENNFSWERCLNLTATVLDTADAHWLARHEKGWQSRVRGLMSGSSSLSGTNSDTAANTTWIEPGHFYSPLVDPQDPHVVDTLEKFETLELPSTSAIELDQEKMTTFFSRLSQRYDQLPFVPHPKPPLHYYYENPYFGYADAITLGLMSLEFRPKHIVEIGAGFSSAAMIDLNEQLFDDSMELTFVEPYPDRLLDLLPENSSYRRRICAQPVQSLSCSLFKRLKANDILFIDSGHVSKMASDLNHLMFNIFPALQPGVLIHLHDIFYPFEYPPSWILEENRSWNEAYLLRAFLEFNQSFEVLFFNHFAYRKFPEVIAQKAPLFLKNCGGSLWLRRTR